VNSANEVNLTPPCGGGIGGLHLSTLRPSRHDGIAVPARTEAGPLPATAEGPPTFKRAGSEGERRDSDFRLQRKPDPRLAACFVAQPSQPRARAGRACGATLPAVTRQRNRCRELFDKSLAWMSYHGRGRAELMVFEKMPVAAPVTKSLIRVGSACIAAQGERRELGSRTPRRLRRKGAGGDLPVLGCQRAAPWSAAARPISGPRWGPSVRSADSDGVHRTPEIGDPRNGGRRLASLERVCSYKTDMQKPSAPSSDDPPDIHVSRARPSLSERSARGAR
jgi:hypothetical protein